MKQRKPDAASQSSLPKPQVRMQIVISSMDAASDPCLLGSARLQANSTGVTSASEPAFPPGNHVTMCTMDPDPFHCQIEPNRASDGPKQPMSAIGGPQRIGPQALLPLHCSVRNYFRSAFWNNLTARVLESANTILEHAGRQQSSGARDLV